MLGKAHVSIGSALGLIVVYSSTDPLATAIAGALSGMAGGLPDVLDSEKAYGRNTMGVSWSGIRRDARRRGRLEKLLLLPLRALFALLLDSVAAVLPHRGVSHWLLTWFLLSGLAAVISIAVSASLTVALAFSIGYLSHLLADAMTVSGVELFAPFYSKPIHLLPKGLRFRYDNPVQWLFVLAIWAAALYLWYPRLSALKLGGLW